MFFGLCCCRGGSTCVFWRMWSGEIDLIQPSVGISSRLFMVETPGPVAHLRGTSGKVRLMSLVCELGKSSPSLAATSNCVVVQTLAKCLAQQSSPTWPARMRISLLPALTIAFGATRSVAATGCTAACLLKEGNDCDPDISRLDLIRRHHPASSVDLQRFCMDQLESSPLIQVPLRRFRSLGCCSLVRYSELFGEMAK